MKKSSLSSYHWPLLILIGLTLGVDKYYASALPYEFFKGIPFVFLVSVLIAPFLFKNTITLKTKFNFYFLTIILYGNFVALIRYFSFYQGDYLFIPIVRQSTSLSIGLFLVIIFRAIYKNSNLFQVALSIIFSSVPFLILGLYQHLTDYQVGLYPRVVSLFSEPSYYGDYLVLLLGPSLLFMVSKLKTWDLKGKIFCSIYIILWLVNLYATQSGTAVLKVLVLVVLFFFFYPIKISWRIGIAATFLFLLTFALYIKRGYVVAMIEYALEVFSHPERFFQFHTFYDRFFPVYAAIKNLFSLEGIWGLGFGGDYYEFKNLYPVATHAEMIHQKPTYSYFNSFGGKVILYLGIFGVFSMFKLILKAFKGKDPILKIGLLNVLVASFWGVSNFSLPYIWFWLALSLIEEENL